MADTRDKLMYSVYFAPRGIARMAEIGNLISQRHLSPFDRVIGIVGEAGSGKSMLVKGMFPGLEMTNDDNGVNVRPLPLLSVDDVGFFQPHTYHMDVRFEMGFSQIGELAEAVNAALAKGRRVVIEHYELIYPFLKRNADLLIGVGEEIIVTRPTIFGPVPADLADIVFQSIRYRKMAHTAEDLTERKLWPEYKDAYRHGDVRHGFILGFENKPDLDIPAIEAYVRERIQDDLPVSFYDEEHIMIGDKIHHCTGPRMHVRSTGEIEGFRLLPELYYDSMSRQYLLVGRVGDDKDNPLDLNRLVL